MPQVDRSIVVHRIAAMLTISYSRTVPIYSRGIGKIGFVCSKTAIVMAKNTGYAAMV